MKKTIFYAFVALLVSVGALWARISPEQTYAPGTVKTDTVTWKATSLPGTTGVRIDTVVGAVDDTSATRFFIGGVKWAAVSFVFSEMGANGGTGGVAIQPQIGPDPTGGLWLSFGALASNAGAPPQVDTVTVQLATAVWDSSVTAVTTGNYRSLNGKDAQRVRGGSWLRFVLVNTNTTNDTTMVHGVLTRVW